MKNFPIIIFFLICFLNPYFKNLAVEINVSEFWKHRVNDDNSDIEKTFLDIGFNGWEGAELDIFYSNEDSIFYISHDELEKKKTYKRLSSIKKLSNQKLWLDFKNLKDVEFSNILKLKKNLNKIAQNNLLYVESQNFIKLRVLSSKKIRTVFNLPIFFESEVYLYFLKIFTHLLSFDKISVSVKHFPLIIDKFPSSYIFLYSVNSSEKLCNIKSQNLVNVVLTKLRPKSLDCRNERN